MMDYSKTGWLKHVLTHPFDGYEDLRWKKGGSLLISFVIVFFFFFRQLAMDRLIGFQYGVSYDKIFNVIPYIVSSILLYGMWVIANWAMCTLLDGEGTLKNIAINTAYALVPYIATSLIGIFLTHFFIQDEYVFIQTLEIIGEAWTFVLLVSGMKAVHQYSFWKTILSMALTVVAMICMLFLLILLLTLFQQVIIFFLSIYTELTYRFRG